MSAPQQRLRVGRPLWLPDTARNQRYPALSGQKHTAVAVVGGGMTGALVAHAFASAGISTTVLEAALIGSGSTAASSALLLKEPDLELAELTKRYGVRGGRRIWELSHQSVEQLVALVKRLRIRCHLETRDAIYYALTAPAAERLQHECEFRVRSGFDAEWLGPAQLRRLTGMALSTKSHILRYAQEFRGNLGHVGMIGLRIGVVASVKRASIRKKVACAPPSRSTSNNAGVAFDSGDRRRTDRLSAGRCRAARATKISRCEALQQERKRRSVCQEHGGEAATRNHSMSISVRN